MDINYRNQLLQSFDSILKKYRLPRIKKLRQRPLFTIKNSLIGRFSHQLLKNKFYFRSEAKTFFGQNMHITIPPYEDIWAYGAFLGYDPETRLTKFIIKNIDDGIVFFDVGAHYGYYSLLVNKVSKNSRVFAFESDTEVFKILARNKKAGIEIINKAVSDRSGIGKFYSMRHMGNKTGSSLNINKVEMDLSHNAALNYNIKEVCTTTLDDFCEQNKTYPNFVKIDVEGAEEMVLSGANKLLKNQNPIIAMEVWIKPFTDNYKNAIEILMGYGYKTFAIKEDGSIELIDRSNLLAHFLRRVESYREMSDCSIFDNLIFIK